MKWTWTGEKPWKHQVKALRKLLALRGGALLMPMRSGKTRVAIDFARASEMKWQAKRVLVVCPKSVKGVWRRQIKRYAKDCGLKWRIVNYEQTYDRVRDPDNPRSWDPVRSDSLVRYIERGKTVLIVDEAHRLGDPTTVQAKETYALSQMCELRVTLTGTPWHRKPLLVFGHYKVLDDSIFGTDWTAFRRQHVVYGSTDYDKHKIRAYTNLEGMRKKVASRAFILKEVPSRPPIHEVVPVRLEGSADIYSRMARDAIVEIKSGRYSSGEIVLTRLLRLSQICGGWLRDEEGGWHRVGTEKRESFRDLTTHLDDGGINKFVVFASYLRELGDVCRVLKDGGWDVYLLRGAVPERLREQRIAAFDEHEGKAAFVSQTATGSLGIDLSSTDTAIFYSPTRSLVNFDQACSRIKKWREKRPLTYYHLLCDGTMDELIYMANQEGLDLAELIFKHPDWIQRG